MTDPTQSLVAAATSGDSNAIDALVTRYLPRLHAYVRLHMGGRLRAREGSLDLVQSVCREALEERDSFVYRGEGPFLRWLFTAALNKLREHARYQNREKRDADREVAAAEAPTQVYATLLTPSREAIDREEVELLERAFERLPDDYRDVITLSRIVGLSSAEIAEHMERSIGSVRMLLGRALRQLAKEFQRGD